MSDVVVITEPAVPEIVEVAALAVPETVEVVTQGPQGIPGATGARGFGLVGVETIADAATIEVDVSLDVHTYRHTIVGLRPLSFVGGTADLDGRVFLFEVTQGAPGGWIFIPDATVAFSVDLPAFELSTQEGAVDLLAFQYHHATGKCRFAGITRNF